MPGLSGVPNRAFQTLRAEVNPRTPISGGEASGQPPEPLTIKVPDGVDTLTDGEIRTVETFVSMKIVKLQCDIPEGVTASLEIDGRQIHTTTDRKGNVGSLEFGDMAAGIGIQVSRVKASFVNTSGQSLDARYFLVGFS